MLPWSSVSMGLLTAEITICLTENGLPTLKAPTIPLIPRTARRRMAAERSRWPRIHFLIFFFFGVMDFFLNPFIWRRY